MKKLFHLPLIVLLCACSTHGLAQDVPSVGLLEQIPVRDVGQKVKAKPLYIFTDKKLVEPTVFSALQLLDSTIDVACCFEVTNITPLSLQSELEKYSFDTEFVEHIKGIKGYNFIYNARPVSKTRWSAAMKTTMEDLTDTSNIHPYSLAIIGTTLSRETMPSTFRVGKSNISYKYNYSQNSARVTHIFTLDGRKIQFSEATVTVEGD